MVVGLKLKSLKKEGCRTAYKDTFRKCLVHI
jgi:hypothetical protein